MSGVTNSTFRFYSTFRPGKAISNPSPNARGREKPGRGEVKLEGFVWVACAVRCAYLGEIEVIFWVS